ncbi:hypothetical protein DIT68_03900 [Brumimicrobium oceani]|uniref:Uncharacterized protein n=1 Tax=Brumimicrobium oceani TaxID=2100725 RepID=A0A2U2XF12_9FLAO|nr:hypothetical protein DIT68_03900 [Brumimicrobium oceani]
MNNWDWLSSKGEGMEERRVTRSAALSLPNVMRGGAEIRREGEIGRGLTLGARRRHKGNRGKEV